MKLKKIPISLTFSGIKIHNFFHRVDCLKASLKELEKKNKKRMKEKTTSLYESYKKGSELTLTYSKIKDISNYFINNINKTNAKIQKMKYEIINKNFDINRFYSKKIQIKSRNKEQNNKYFIKRIYTLDECNKMFNNLQKSNSSRYLNINKKKNNMLSTLGHTNRINIVSTSSFNSINKEEIEGKRSLIKSESAPMIIDKINDFYNEYDSIMKTMKKEKKIFLKRNLLGISENEKLIDQRAEMKIIKLRQKHKKCSNIN